MGRVEWGLLHVSKFEDNVKVKMIIHNVTQLQLILIDGRDNFALESNL